MIDYRQIWNSINDESRNSATKSQIARRVPSDGVFPVFLATDFRKGIRLLYVRLYDLHEIVTDNLPRFRGLDISVAITSIGSFKNEEFLKFTQSIPNTDNIFESVIADICDKIILIDEERQLSTTVEKGINEWKNFFEKQEFAVLPISAQKGLYGELHFLFHYVFKKYSFVHSLSCWTGADKTNHDFQIFNNAVEVKATSSKQHKRFLISSERQLDSTGLQHLYLLLYSLNVHINMPGRTLPALVREIYTEIEGDPIAAFLLEIKLAKYGYNEFMAEKYTTGFSISGIRLFGVIDGFPRLLQRNLPNGIGDLKYSVAVAACAPFEIDDDITKYF